MAKHKDIIKFEKKYCDAQGRKPDKNGYITCSTPRPKCKFLQKNGKCIVWEIELKKFWADYPKNTIKRIQKRR